MKFEAGERDPITGKRATKTTTVRGTKRDAERELNRILSEIDSGSFVEPNSLTVSSYLEMWLSDRAKVRVSAKTFERYAEIVRKHLIPGLGKRRLAKLAPLQVQAYYGKMLTEGRIDGKGGLSAQTVKHTHRILSEALRQAVRLRLISSNPCSDVDPPRPVRHEMKTADHAQAGAIITAAETSRIHIPVLLALTTGLRRGEILALRWSDLNLPAGVLSVVRTLERTREGLRFKEPKTARSRRTVTLPALTVERLRRHRIRQAEQRLRLGPIYQDNDLVCCNDDGQPTSPQALTKAFHYLVSKLGIAVRFHDLRHSHMTHLLAAGVHPKVASERAGHASVAITLDLYSHVVPGMQEDAAKQIDAALRTHLER